MGHLLARAHEVDCADAGDVLLIRIGRCYAHGGIVTVARPLTIIHAFAPARRVIEDELERSSELSTRPIRLFSYWRPEPADAARQPFQAE